MERPKVEASSSKARVSRPEGGTVDAEGESVVSEGGLVVLEGRTAGGESGSVLVEGESVLLEGGSVGAEGGSVGAEGGSVRAEGGSVRAEGGSVGAEGGSALVEDRSLWPERGAVPFEGRSVLPERGTAMPEELDDGAGSGSRPVKHSPPEDDRIMAKANAKKAAAPRRSRSAPPVPAAPDGEFASEIPSGITKLEVEGFKSIRKRTVVVREPTHIAIRPLTILAGANSSGKSSIMQPLLLMKQTLEATSDPGVFLLDGPNVRFTSAQQMFSQLGPWVRMGNLEVGFHTTEGRRMEVTYLQRMGGGGVRIELLMEGTETTWEQHLQIPDSLPEPPGNPRKPYLRAVRDRCFLARVDADIDDGSWAGDARLHYPRAVRDVRANLLSMIHVPAMHGNPERTYRSTAAGPNFPGTFEPYVASIIHDWQSRKDERLAQLGAALQRLGLTWKVQTARIDDTRLEVRVGRHKKRVPGAARDLVSIADVGFGVSQCLPVLVALLVARKDQLVYIEEPEMHLHPRAQVALAQILADAANRGVRLVIETHSSLLLLAVQTLVAEGALPPKLVALHWFSLTDDGVTEVRSADLDAAGAFGDWPEDFAEVTLDAQARYLDAAEKRLTKGDS